MPSGLIALLDDVATLTKLAAASVDDLGYAVGRASTRVAGVVIDDMAVTPRYVTGLAPERELPIIGKIAWGSLKNKMLILLPAALLLATFLPVLITPLLMIGGAYLAFEATEKILEKLFHDHHHEQELLEYGTKVLEGIDGVRLIGTARRKASILSFVMSDVHPHDIGTIVDREGVAIRTGRQPPSALKKLVTTKLASSSIRVTRPGLGRIHT